MNNPAYAALDQTELLQLALHAGSTGDAAAAIACLKEAAARPDATANVHYLLGAEYAQCQLYDRAIDALEAAIALDPALSMARFQLGLLLTCCGQPGRAEVILQPLRELDADDPLHLFGAGLTALIADRLAECLELLERGIGHDHVNPALRGDMRRLADEVRKALDKSGPTEEATPDEAAETGTHMLLSAYTGNVAQ